MSLYSGIPCNCDFFDTIEKYGLAGILNSLVLVGDSKIPIDMTIESNRVTYYPHKVDKIYYDEQLRKCCIRLNPRSNIDIGNERYGRGGEFIPCKIAKQDWEKELERVKKLEKL